MFKFLYLFGLLAVFSVHVPPSESREPLDNSCRNQANTPMMLPENFTVTDQNGDGPVGPRVLPTVNRYQGADGGYVAFYTRNPHIGLYSVGGGIYVVGQVRLQGEYWGRIFQPAGYEGEDISAEQVFKDLADEVFPQCKGGCWAGGDTGGWLGRH